MERRKNTEKNRNIRRGRRRGLLPVLLVILLGIGGFFGWMHINASLTHLKFAEVYLEDLPAYVPEAIIAVEDRRFYSHFGFDIVMFHVLIYDL